MGNVNGGTPDGHFAILLVDVALGDGIERGGRFVQHEDGRVLIERTGQHQPLQLAAGKLLCVFIHFFHQVGVHAMGQGADLVSQAGSFQAVLHPRAVKAFQILRHILRDARGHQGKVLVHSAQQGLVRGAVIRPDVAAVQPHFAAGRVVESTQQLHQRGFARAIQAYDGQLFARRDGQIDVRKHIFFRARIAKGNVAQFQRACIARPERGRRFTAFQRKRFGIRPKFAYGGKLQALPVQRGEGRKDARDPCGEAADGRKVQQEFCHRQFARQGLRDEIGIGYAIARQGEQRIDGVGQKIAFAGARVEGMIGAPRAAKHLFNPGPHAENA